MRTSEPVIARAWISIVAALFPRVNVRTLVSDWMLATGLHPNCGISVVYIAKASGGAFESLMISLPVHPSPLPRIREFSLSKLVPGGIGMSVKSWKALARLAASPDASPGAGFPVNKLLPVVQPFRTTSIETNSAARIERWAIRHQKT